MFSLLLRKFLSVRAVRFLLPFATAHCLDAALSAVVNIEIKAKNLVTASDMH
jgi:hypothetical protein